MRTGRGVAGRRNSCGLRRRAPGVPDLSQRMSLWRGINLVTRTTPGAAAGPGGGRSRRAREGTGSASIESLFRGRGGGGGNGSDAPGWGEGGSIVLAVALLAIADGWSPGSTS